MKQLIIAEKPSVAQSIAAVLGAPQKRKDYIECGDYLISWCYGHLTSLADADAYDASYKKWSLEQLPILPDPFQFKAHEDKQKQFASLRTLMRRTDVATIINACDAGREGELIFRTVYTLAGCKKPVLRLWISSMEDTAIRAGFQKLRSSADFDGLYQSALCRAKADWLVGINATRFFSLQYGQTLNIGRVMSPTLALLVEREAEIKAFEPEQYFTVQLALGFNAVSERIPTKAQAEDLASASKGNSATVLDVTNIEKTESAPKLFDLTALQREANQHLGYTAQQTLDYLQALYEKKLCTYPRTDSRYIPDEMAANVPTLAAISASVCNVKLPGKLMSEQICDSKKVTDHHAILPTSSVSQFNLTSLPDMEQKLLQLICHRVVLSLCPPHRHLETIATLTCADHTFTARGRQIIDQGWRAYEAPSEVITLPLLAQDQTLEVRSASVKAGTTKPPKHHTEATLLAAMENIVHANTSSERRGIGTPATRAGIIDKLVRLRFIERKRSNGTTHLVPTTKGIDLIAVLPEHLRSPQLTAEWEQELKMIEAGALSPDAFLRDISQMLQNLVSTYQRI